MRRIKVGDQIRHRVFDVTRTVTEIHSDGICGCTAVDNAGNGVLLSAKLIDEWWEIADDIEVDDSPLVPGVGGWLRPR